MAAKKKTSRTAEIQAMIALGRTPTEEQLAAGAEEDGDGNGEEEVTTSAGDDAKPKEELKGEGEGKGDTEVPEAPKTDASLLNEVKSLSRDNAKLELKVEGLEARVAGFEASEGEARKVITEAIERLGIALNSTPAGLEDMSLNALCTHYHKLNKQFAERFPVGATAREASARADGKNNDTSGVSEAELRNRVKSARKATRR